MKTNGKYVIAVALLAVLAVVFGLTGTVMPVPELTSPQQSPTSDAFTRFASTEATYDSGWVDVRDKRGQHFTLTHGLNTTEVIVDVEGRRNFDPEGTPVWNQTYGGANPDSAFSVVQTLDGGYAIAGETESYGAGLHDFWLVKTDENGFALWNKTYGGTDYDRAYSVIQTADGDYVLAGDTRSHGLQYDYHLHLENMWLVKTGAEVALVWTSLTPDNIVLYRGETDLEWNFVRVRIWLIKEPTWQFGDINMDGVVDARDPAILGRNYGKTFSVLSFGGIVAVAGIHTIKKGKQAKQPSYIS